MSDTEQREIAEPFFEPKQSREHLEDAIKEEEARRAAMVKNLYRLRSLRLSRDQASTQERLSCDGAAIISPPQTFEGTVFKAANCGLPSCQLIPSGWPGPLRLCPATGVAAVRSTSVSGGSGIARSFP
jgi:hypothetical protein